MAIVKVEKNSYTVESLYQWDLNQVLEIRGLSLPSVPEIHFTNEAMDRAIVRQASMDSAGIVSVYIPNSLLQKPYKITAYICIYTGATFESLYKIEILVKARTQPSDYTITDDEETYSFKALENAVNNALVACDTAEKNLATATENLKNAENVLKQAVADIDDMVTEKVTDEVIETLPDFLDSTLKMTDKAAQAAAVGAVGAKLDTLCNEFDSTWKMEKIADVTLTEDVKSFYIELPETLYKYACIMVKSFDLYGTHVSPIDVYVYPVDSLTSTEVTNFLFLLDRVTGTAAINTLVMLYPAQGNICFVQRSNDSFTLNRANSIDTKYLYLKSGDDDLYATIKAGGRIEMWGVTQ